MNDVRDLCNHRHPKQALVGVCPFCLNEKLLIIAASQQPPQNHHQPSHSRKPSNGGLLSFGSLLSRLELRRSHRHRSHRGSCDFDDNGASSDTQSTSPTFEDSFISIKFEENGVASWDKHKGSDAYVDADHNMNKSIPQGSLRWRKRIGHLLQLVKRKRFKEPNHDSYGRGQVINVPSIEME